MDCAQCGFVYGECSEAEAVREMRRASREIRERLGRALSAPGGLELLRTRPAEGVWSMLEYAGHVRDVLLIQRERLYLALVTDAPRLTPLYRDERALLAHYNDEDPATTATEVVLAAELLCRGFDSLDAAGWSRRLLYPPEPIDATVTWLAQHTTHECLHHLEDIDSVAARVGLRVS